jgi:hypothetical protein
MLNRIILLNICFFALAAGVFAQELNATVSVNFQNLPVQNKESLVNFAQALQTYLNTTKFSGEDWRYDKINCNFNIQVATASDEVNYTAQLVVNSQRKIYHSPEFSPMLKVFDNNWAFLYEKNQAFIYNPQIFNSVTSLLNYYAYLIIGLECDSWTKMSGNPYFSKAYDMVNLGSITSFSSGWVSAAGGYNRRDLIDDMLAERYRPVREGFADYHYAIDMYAQKNNFPAKRDLYVQKAQEKLVAFVKMLESLKAKMDARSIYLKMFFDAKHGELIDRLRGYRDREIFKTLKYIDPPHTAKYDEALKN